MDEIDLVLFDLDGTLYEDEGVYDRYAEELARYLPPAEARRYLAEWERAKRRDGIIRVGLGFDAARDLLFRHDGRAITSYLTWDGEELPSAPARASGEDGENPLEVPAFGPDRFSIGDWWRLPDVLAARYGVPRERRGDAFMAVRAHMASDAYRFTLEEGVTELLERLRSRGTPLIAMSNSPRESVEHVLDSLGIRQCFDTVVGDAHKPVGLRRFLEQEVEGAILSVGDNFVNDILPVLDAGGYGLYVDRHETGLGCDRPRCRSVRSIQGAVRVLRDWFDGRVPSSHDIP